MVVQCQPGTDRQMTGKNFFHFLVFFRVNGCMNCGIGFFVFFFCPCFRSFRSDFAFGNSLTLASIDLCTELWNH
jgi:hypothetical protein